MKVRATVKKVVDIEIEIDDKYQPLSNDAFWSANPFEAEHLSFDMAWDIEETADDIEVICVEDMNGRMIFEG